MERPPLERVFDLVFAAAKLFVWVAVIMFVAILFDEVFLAAP